MKFLSFKGIIYKTFCGQMRIYKRKVIPVEVRLYLLIYYNQHLNFAWKDLNLALPTLMR